MCRFLMTAAFFTQEDKPKAFWFESESIPDLCAICEMFEPIHPPFFFFVYTGTKKDIPVERIMGFHSLEDIRRGRV